MRVVVRVAGEKVEILATDRALIELQRGADRVVELDRALGDDGQLYRVALVPDRPEEKLWQVEEAPEPGDEPLI